MKIEQKRIDSIRFDVFKTLGIGFEAKLGNKLFVAGEVTSYVRDYGDARMCPVLDNPIPTLPRTKFTLLGGCS